MTRRPRRKAEDTRAEILAVAERLFGERGIAGCSIAHVAQALSMSPANIFKHFHSKVALIDAICQRKIDVMVGQIQTFDVKAPAPERLQIAAERLMMTHIASLDDTPYILEMIFVLSEHDSPCGALYKEMIDDLFHAIIQHGRAEGIYHCSESRDVSRTVAAAFAAVLHPVFLARQDPDELIVQCRQLSALVNAALQNPLVK